MNDFRLPVHQRMQAAQSLIELGDKFTAENKPDPTEEQLGEVLFPKVIADKKPKRKQLPAPTAISLPQPDEEYAQ